MIRHNKIIKALGKTYPVKVSTIFPGFIKLSEVNGKSLSFQLTKKTCDWLCSKYCNINPNDNGIATKIDVVKEKIFFLVNFLTLNKTRIKLVIAKTIVDII